MKTNNNGVSPLVAMVLMIAIALVLAAVLCPMSGLPPDPDTPPAGSFEDVSAISSTEGLIVFGNFSYDVHVSDLCIFIATNGTDAGVVMWNGRSYQIFWHQGPEGAEAFLEAEDFFIDVYSVQRNITSGDSIHFIGLQPGTEYSNRMHNV